LAAYDQEGIHLTRLAKTLGMERTMLSRNVSLLERMGMVSATMGEDRRERKIAITVNGVDLLEEMVPHWQKTQNEVVEAIVQKKWEGLLAGLHRVAKAL
jgi:DNA-binding MarR family transcriptional regulator